MNFGGASSSRVGKLNVLIFYDDRFTHIGTVYEHLDAFRKYSRHQIYLVPASGERAPEVDIDVFDVVIHHYAVRLSLPAYVNLALAQRLAAFRGLKILFIQDEYDFTETARQWIERLGFNVVYTCVPQSGRELVYPSSRFPSVDFLPTLTGFVPETDDLDAFALPMHERRLRIGYRGRILPYVYGMLGHEKYRIGVDVRRLAAERGIPVDIEVDDRFRIYGSDWYKFLGSVRATLGSESGSNVFDFNGHIGEEVTRYLAESPQATFEQVFLDVLKPHEGLVQMNQVSPKVFEAIRLRTALVLFEGGYSGVVEPEEHYIALKKDYSNIDEVFKKLEDVKYLEQLTRRAFEDIVGSGRYSYREFVRQVDQEIERRVPSGPKYEIFSTPVVVRNERGTSDIAPSKSLGFCVSTGILSGDFQREQLAELMADEEVSHAVAVNEAPEGKLTLRERPASELAVATQDALPLSKAVRGLWRVLPIDLRTSARLRVVELIERARQPGDVGSSRSLRIVQAVWRRVLPKGIRHWVLSALKGG